MDALLRPFLYYRDSTGQWVPVGWVSRLTLAAGLLMLSWFLWEGITEVRRGEKNGWRIVWWAVLGFVIWALFIALHACRLWSPQWIAIQAATVVGGIAWAIVGFRKGYPLRGDEDGETEAADEAGAAAVEPPDEERRRQEERPARERLHDRARAVQGEAARRRTEPWRRLSRVCCVAWRLSLQVLLFSALAACACTGLGMLWGDSDVLWAWFVRALVWQACVAGFAGLAWLAARAADWRLARELDRLEPPRADPNAKDAKGKTPADWLYDEFPAARRLLQEYAQPHGAGGEQAETEAAVERSWPSDHAEALDVRAVLQAAQETASVHPDAHVKVVGPRPEDVERVELRWHGRRLGKRIIVQPSGEDWSLKVEALAETDLLVLPPWASRLVLALRVAALPVVALWLILALTMAYEGLGWDREILASALVVLAAAAPFIYYVARPAGAKTSLHRVMGPLAFAETEEDASDPRDLMAQAWEWLESLTPLDVVNGSREAESAVDTALQDYAFAHDLRVKRGADRQWWIVGPRVRVEVAARPLSEFVLSDRSPRRGRVQGAVLAWAELPRLGEHLDSLRARQDEEGRFGNQNKPG